MRITAWRAARGGAACRDDTAASPTAEFMIMLLLFLFLLGGFSSYVLAAHARGIIIQAADAGGRRLAIECGADNPNAAADAENLAAQTMQQEGLSLTSQPADINSPGTYTITASCSSGNAILTIEYEQKDLFPPMGPVVDPGQPPAPSFDLSTGAVFPVE